MTKFNPNVTPESNVFSEVVRGDAWLLMTGLEKRARTAEEKLRIAIITLMELADPNSLFDSVLFSQSQLEEIERVGK